MDLFYALLKENWNLVGNTKKVIVLVLMMNEFSDCFLNK